MTIHDNMLRVENARARVEEHCVCARSQEDRTHYFVEYPPGFRFGGCRVSKGMGAARALSVLLARMEQHWKEEQL